MKNKRTVLASFADFHSGHVLGLIPNEPWQTEEGTYTPGYTQKIAWKKYMEVCTQINKERYNSRLVALYNGDLTDGLHHRNTSIWATTTEEQERCAIDCIDRGLQTMGFSKKAGDILQVISGTEAHAGAGHQSEERIAHDLGAVPYRKPSAPHKKDGKYLWPWRNVIINGVRFDISHHGPSLSKRAWTEANTIQSVLTSRYLTAKEYGEDIPKEWWFVWAHNHRCIHATVNKHDCTLHGITLPAFQGITHFGNKIMPANKIADIGGVWFVIEVDGTVRVVKDYIRFTPQEAEAI